MARPREIPDLRAEESYRTAARKVISVRAGELFEHSAGVLDVSDIERVHDMRVATRRLRAALEIFRPCLPKREFSAALRDVKGVADALGERRDADVAIAAIEQVAAVMPSPDRRGIDTFVSRLREEQEGANERLAKAVDKDRLEALRSSLASLTGSLAA